MKQKNILAFLLILLSFNSLNAQDFAQYVNPFIGTGGHGHNFPGATRPFAMVQLSPDNRLEGWDWCSGYHYSDSVMLGFSHTHLSGTGIGDLGDILLCPQVGEVTTESGSYDKPDGGYAFRFSHNNEKAAPGYYSVLNLDDSILVELTSTARVGFHRYTFPQSDQANIIVDLGSTIYDPKRERLIETQLEIVNSTTIQGYKIVKGWAPLRKVYFYMQFSKPFVRYGGGHKAADLKPIELNRSTSGGVVTDFTFSSKANEPILVKVAISFVSIENAKENAKEIKGWDFDAVVQDSKNEWNSYLSKIEIEGTQKQKEIFYTGLYHTMVHPNNIADSNGEYFGPDYNIHTSKTGNYYSTFSLWDTYRAVHPLFTLLMPEKVGDMANSMIEHFKYNGYLPIWTLAGTENHCMEGNHSIPVLADAIHKGIKGFDYNEAWKAVKSSSTIDHMNSNWNRNNYDERGYMATGIEWHGPTKTLDFVFDDCCAAQMAKDLGHAEDYDYFRNRSGFYKNLFNAEKGLTWPKDVSGNFVANFDPTLVAWNNEYTEGNAWQYTFLVQHDPKGLIALYPSKEKFLEKLDSLFLETNVPNSKVGDVEAGIYGQYIHSNEPSHHIAYFYNYANQAHKTQKLIHNILVSEYRNEPNGLSGNEDCGQMSAWYVFNSMGLYPENPAAGIYDFGSPILKKATIQLENDKTFTIEAVNLSASNIYIKGITLNGKPYHKLFITHKDLMNGGELKFTMYDKPNFKLGKYELPAFE